MEIYNASTILYYISIVNEKSATFVSKISLKNEKQHKCVLLELAKIQMLSVNFVKQ